MMKLECITITGKFDLEKREPLSYVSKRWAAGGREALWKTDKIAHASIKWGIAMINTHN
jgi:hypothetical protein